MAAKPVQERASSYGSVGGAPLGKAKPAPAVDSSSAAASKKVTPKPPPSVVIDGSTTHCTRAAAM